MSVAPVFIRSLALVRRFVAVSAADLTPLERFLFYESEPGRVHKSLIKIGEIVNRNKPTGIQNGSVQKRVDWKALEIVHPDAAGIDVGGSEHWVAIGPDRDPGRGPGIGILAGWQACVCRRRIAKCPRATNTLGTCAIDLRMR